MSISASRSTELRERLRIAKVAALVEEALPQPVAGASIAFAVWQEFADLIAKCVRSQVVHRHAHDREIVRKQLRLHQIEEGWNEFALGQIAGSAEKHEHTWTGGLAGILEIEIRVRRGVRCHECGSLLIPHGIEESAL